MPTHGGLVGTAHVRGSSETTRMILLAFTTVGIVFVWGVEMTYCTPYLLSLGLSKSTTSLVWIAGPLSGIIVQPIIGTLSDGSTSSWGRRRPVIMAGTVIVAAALLVLGFTEAVMGIFGVPREWIVWGAVAAIYVVDFAINAVMSCSRSLIVDTLPIEKQQAGAAWASRLAAIGHVIGYAAGAIDLPIVLNSTLTQFQLLILLAIVFVLTSSSISCWAVTERVLLPKSGPPESKMAVFGKIWNTLMYLPPRVQAICWAQFWGWIGWFPFQFYSTTWVGEIYYRYDAPGEGSGDRTGDIGRIGSQALVLYSTVTFLGAWLLPMVVRRPDEKGYTKRPPKSIEKYVDFLEKWKPDIVTAWMVGDCIFAAAMFCAPIAKSWAFATTLVCICGVPWAVAGWAPVATLGEEVNRLSQGYSGIPMSPMSPTRPERGHRRAASEVQTGGEELSGIYFGILNIYSTMPQFLGNFISTVVFSILEPAKGETLGSSKEDGPNPIAVCLFIGAISAVLAAVAAARLRRLLKEGGLLE